MFRLCGVPAPAGELIRLGSGQAEMIKWIAIVSMVIDHANHILLDRAVVEMTAVGRIAFPLFAFLLVHNSRHFSRDPRKQILRLLAFGVFAQPVVSWGLDSWQLNILFTLGLGLTLSEVWRSQGPWVGAWASLVALVLSPFMDYGPPGVFAVAVCGLWVASGRTGWAVLASGLFWLANGLQPIGLCAALALPGISLYKHLVWKEVAFPRSHRWFFHIFYPAHIAILAVIGMLR